MGWNIGDKVVCVVDTNKHIKRDKIYTINTVNDDKYGFISLCEVVNKCGKPIYFNPNRHFEKLNNVRMNKINTLTSK